MIIIINNNHLCMYNIIDLAVLFHGIVVLIILLCLCHKSEFMICRFGRLLSIYLWPVDLSMAKVYWPHFNCLAI